jgi:hypothetical protein
MHYNYNLFILLLQKGETPLMEARKKGNNSYIIEDLIRRGADMEVVNEVLHYILICDASILSGV